MDLAIAVQMHFVETGNVEYNTPIEEWAITAVLEAAGYSWNGKRWARVEQSAFTNLLGE